ncbi:phosphatase 2C [Dispira parvispora]|uniref:Phosphatase 2C n=1 Tax=Dispira parvispora TaxID=1520584 RepID=A0A9W8E681_9FUNG|nr:phosphatase 2C [Dispira parvispora]
MPVSSEAHPADSSGLSEPSTSPNHDQNTLLTTPTEPEFRTVLRKPSASLVRASIPPPINTTTTVSPLSNTVLPSPAPPVGLSTMAPSGTGQPGTFRVGIASDRNRRWRRTMEDSHSFLYDFNRVPGQGFFTIFDGHAGKQAAEWCGIHFHEIFLEHLKELEQLKQAARDARKELTAELSPDSNSTTTPTTSEPTDSSPPLVAKTVKDTKCVLTSDTSIAELFQHTFTEADRRLSADVKSQSGCTVVAAFLSKDDGAEDNRPSKWTLHTANAGDARGVLARQGRAVRLTYDHKGSDPHEVRRVTEAGGFVMNNRVNGVLAVTRALGDSSMKSVVVGNPYTTETELTADDAFVILACDGLWDACSDQKAVDLVRDITDPQNACERLIKYALENNCRDNITVMVVRLYH